MVSPRASSEQTVRSRFFPCRALKKGGHRPLPLRASCRVVYLLIGFRFRFSAEANRRAALCALLLWPRACCEHAARRRHVGSRCASAGSDVSDDIKCCRGAPASSEERVGAAGKPVVGKPCALSTARGHGAGLLLLRLNARGPRSLSRGARWAHTLVAVRAWALHTPARRLHSAPAVAEVRGSFDAPRRHCCSGAMRQPGGRR
jgi:hypothetical protein